MPRSKLVQTSIIYLYFSWKNIWLFCKFLFLSFKLKSCASRDQFNSNSNSWIERELIFKSWKRWNLVDRKECCEVLDSGDESFCSPGSSLIAEFSEVLMGHWPHLSPLFGSTRWAFCLSAELRSYVLWIHLISRRWHVCFTCDMLLLCFPSASIHLNGICSTGTCSTGRTVCEDYFTLLRAFQNQIRLGKTFTLTLLLCYKTGHNFCVVGQIGPTWFSCNLPKIDTI